MKIPSEKSIFEEVIEAPDKDIVDIEKTDRTPKIYFNKHKGIIKITGRAMPENARLFFGPLLQWIEKYIKTPKDKTYIHLDLEYFNSSTSKLIIQMLNPLKEIEKKGKELIIEWYYMEEDDDILDSGKTFEELSGLKFKYISYE